MQTPKNPKRTKIKLCMMQRTPFGFYSLNLETISGLRSRATLLGVKVINVLQRLPFFQTTKPFDKLRAGKLLLLENLE
jgi:hypothetical protein